MNDITVCIATIPPRGEQLAAALASVAAQSRQPQAIVVEYDHGRTGAAATKNRALARVSTTWTAFLDDDDAFLPHHLERLLWCAETTGADVVYPIPHVPRYESGRDPMGRYEAPFDEAELRRRSYIQTTTLVRTELFHKAGGFQLPKQFPGCPFDDWGAWLALLDVGAKFVHLPETTFVWNHWGKGEPGIPGNTSGMSSRW
ncbi:glycosyltransferase [Kitasatospora sp. NPDC048545]|uniref:glycosyltransferase family 2 protein n=1 Tax=Kitasatospora sp. NPDC048545 TaxID=3157208 RepID=UPI0033CF2D8C